jgi:hypothetical protein
VPGLTIVRQTGQTVRKRLGAGATAVERLGRHEIGGLSIRQAPPDPRIGISAATNRDVRFTRAVGSAFSGLHGPEDGGDAEDVNGSPEIIGERGQAELGIHAVQPPHQERALVHPLFDRAEGVFDRFAAPVENVGAGGKPLGHAVEHRLAFPPVDGPRRTGRALWLECAVPAGLPVAVADGAMTVLLRAAERIEALPGRAGVAVLRRIVGESVLAEIALVDGRTTLWAGDVGDHTDRLAGSDVLPLVVALVGYRGDPLDAQ